MTSQNYKPEDLKILHFVPAVCKRPRMYTRGGSYWEIIAYITGYYNGKDPSLYSGVTNQFGAWYAEKFSMDRQQVVWDHIARRCESDGPRGGVDTASALRLLSDLWTEFENDREQL